MVPGTITDPIAKLRNSVLKSCELLKKIPLSKFQVEGDVELFV